MISEKEKEVDRQRVRGSSLCNCIGTAGLRSTFNLLDCFHRAYPGNYDHS